jgi:hypothetical protein
MTKTKYALSILLLLLLAGAGLTARRVFNKEAPASPAREDTSATAGEAVVDGKSAFDLSSFEERRILAVYFHGTIRCKTCLKIEKMARDTVTSGFGGENGSGGIFWAAVNYDVPENDRYIAELQIELPSLILMEVEDGKVRRWKNLRKTWDLADDEQSFSKYVSDEIIGFASP